MADRHSVEEKFRPLIFCMNCGHILAADKHHLDCPTRKGLEYRNGKWVKAHRTDEKDVQP